MRIAGALLLLALVLLPVAAEAAPTLVATPTTIRPGQTIHVVASGITASNQTGINLCVGLLGPGRNVELGLSPAFRPNLGPMAISAQGTGQADLPVPGNLVAGSYQIVLGGCSPHGDIAPLAAIAAATVTTVTNPSSLPAGLPATGGVPEIVLPIASALGILAIGLGWWPRRYLFSSQGKE